jgi:hypothetical protein
MTSKRKRGQRCATRRLAKPFFGRCLTEGPDAGTDAVSVGRSGAGRHANGNAEAWFVGCLSGSIDSAAARIATATFTDEVYFQMAFCQMQQAFASEGAWSCADADALLTIFLSF